MKTQETARRLLTRAEVLRLAGISTSSLYRLMAAHGFPPAIAFPSGGRRWDEAEVLAWIDRQPRSGGAGKGDR